MASTFIERKFVIFARVARNGVQNFIRNLWLTTAATAMMFVTLTILSFMVVSNLAVNETVEGIVDDIGLSVYIKDEADPNQVNALKAALEAAPAVESVTLKSKEQAFQDFVAQNEGENALLQGLTVTGNVFPASFEVKLKDLTKEDSVVGVASQEQFKDAVDSVGITKQRQAAISSLTSAQRFLTRAGLAAGAAFALISILIIFNTIRMAIYTRSDEIEIMKLIGATPGYIRGPFLFEAALYGLIAGALAFALVYSGLVNLGPKLIASGTLQMEETVATFRDNWALGLLALLGAGMGIGLLSGGVSMARYLRLSRW